MNSNSAVATGAAAITGAAVGNVIVWFCAAYGIAAPTPDVAGDMGALALGLGHAAVNFLRARFPTRKDISNA